MAATVRTSSSATTGAAVAGSVSPAIPTGTTTGDLMVASVSTNGTTNITTPSGWTLFDSNPNSTVNKIWIYYRFWQSGDAAPSFALASGTAMMSAGIISVIGADPLFPFAGDSLGANNTASATLPTVASTPKSINTLQISFHATRNTTAAATITPNILSENIDTSTTATPFIGLWGGSRTWQTGSQAAVLNQTATTASVRTSCTLFVRSAQNSSDITPDVSVIADDTVGNSTITTAAFTTNRASELLVAYVGASGTGGTTTVSGAGLTWTKKVESSVNGGTVAIWTAFASSVVTAQTVTAAFSVASNTVSLTVVSYYGAAQILGTTNSATSASGSAPTVNLTTTVNNSLVVSISSIVNATTFVAGTGVFVARNKSDGLSHQYGVLNASAVTATSGTVVTMGATTTGGSTWDTVALEIEPSVAPTVALNTPADTATGIGTTPVLEFTGTDANGDLIEYEVEVDSVNTFDSQTVADTIVFDAASASVDGTTSPHTWSHTIGSGTNRLLVVQIAVQGSTQGTVTAVTYGGVSMTKATAKQQVTTAGDSEVSIWLLSNPAVGTATVSVTATMPTLPDISGVGQSYFGAQQSTTPDAIGSGGGSTAGTSTASLTTVATGAWIVGMMNFFGNGSTSGSITSSQTIRKAQSMVSNLNGRYAAVDTNATVTPGSNTITFSSTDGTGATQRGYAIAAISIAPGTVQVPLIDKVSTSDTGFLNTVNGGNTHPFTSAQKVSYTVQVANTLAGGTYYWRARGIDPSGSNTYGAWATTRSFTVTAGSTLTKTQPAVARIAINQTLAQPATARVAKNIPKTQPAISRIAVTVTKTQPAIARVARNLTLTQAATARIANSGVVKTQSAIARIATNRANTQTAISRISNTRTLTQAAVARLSQTYTKTQPAVAHIASTITKTQPTIARIQTTSTKTQPSIARIAQTVSKTQSASSRISNTRALTQPAIARVAKNLTKTQTATANIIVNTTVAKTQSAIARIATNRSNTQSATSRISQNYTKTQPAIARLANNITKTQPATARIVKSVTATQSATARVANTRTKTQPAISRISQTYTKTQPVISRIATNRTLTQSATAKITVNGSQLTKTQSAIARIATNRANTQTATSRIANNFTTTQGARSRIAQIITKTQPATSRISQIRALTQSATASITATQIRSLTQSATAHIYQTAIIERSTELTLVAPAAIALTLTQKTTTITGKVPIVTNLVCKQPAVISLVLVAKTTSLTLTQRQTALTATLSTATSLTASLT